MLKASYSRYVLRFINPATTSRSTMTVKETFFVKVWDSTRPDIAGIGECGLFRGLSADDTRAFETILAQACRDIDHLDVAAVPASAVRMGIETALLDLDNGGRGVIYDTDWTAGRRRIAINGLVWMGNRQEMAARIAEKIEAGFRCVKLKIGGIDFESELGLIEMIRRQFSTDSLELRLDANGAFTPDNAMARLDRLAPMGIHSIEQPIRKGQWQAMARICRESPIPIALDEELIGLTDDAEKARLLDTIKPAYIILKPTLCGGLAQADSWIAAASGRGIGWWATSALESNVGLSAIAQWVSRHDRLMPQGLGTGALYTNNIPAPVRLSGDSVVNDPCGTWDYSAIRWNYQAT